MKSYDQIVKAELFAYTMLNKDYGVELDGMMELIAYCAKVSNPSSDKQKDMDKADSLIKYLIKNSHWSPLEMADVVLRIETTRDIGRQLIRHPSFRFQEFSQRYAEGLTEDDQGTKLVLSEARYQDEKNRQSSIELDLNNLKDVDLYFWWNEHQIEIAKKAQEVYQEAIDKGMAKEIARKILPEGMTTTTMFVKGSIRSWIHYLELRLGNGTQKEHVMLAECCSRAINKVFNSSLILKGN